MIAAELLAAIAVAAPAVAPDAAALAQGWEQWRTALDGSARHPLHLDDESWQRIARGEIAKRRDRLDGTDRVIGVAWVGAGVEAVWVAMYDGHGQYADNVVYEELPGSTFESRYVYQRIDLPWPFADRQWVIRVEDNPRLRVATGGQVWERTWDLSDRRGAAAEDPRSVWLDVNEGGWLLAPAAGGTLLVYHVRTSIGGIVPDEAALRWSFSQLDGMLGKIVERTGWVRGHYIGAHEPVRRPDGAPIQTFAGP
jgi:hypothetical protein